MVVVRGVYKGLGVPLGVSLRVLPGLRIRAVVGGVISRVPTIVTHIRGLIAPLITTHEPPSRR